MSDRQTTLGAGMAERPADDDAPRRSVLVIGQGRLADVVRRALDDAGAQVIHLREPTDRQIRRALSPDVVAVMVIGRDDRALLRYALVVEGLRPARSCAARCATCGSCRWRTSWLRRWRPHAWATT